MDRQSVGRSLRGTMSGLRRFEGVLASILVLFPVILALSEDDVRGSISAYHDMDDPRRFFIPFTATVMMLIVNGLVHSRRHGYNAVLGVLLFGVVLFDHDEQTRTLHGGSAIAFYGLSLVFVALQVTDYLDRHGEPWALRTQRLISIGLFALQVGTLVVVNAASGLFWAEAVGLWIIAGHYLWHAGRYERNLESDEPTQVFTRLYGPINKFIVVMLSPLDWAWKIVTRP